MGGWGGAEGKRAEGRDQALDDFLTFDNGFHAWCTTALKRPQRL